MRTELSSVLTGTIGLAILLGVSTLLTFSRPRLSTDLKVRTRFTLLAALAIAAQALHFAEEHGTGFRYRFPALLGLTPWSSTFFVSFNVAWLLVWTLSAYGVRAGRVAALLPLWFLALAMVLNGVAHCVMALRVRGYFPGLITAPLVGILGLVLLQQLSRLTCSDRSVA